MALGARTDPFLAFNFLVEIAGLVVGGFTDVTGLESEIEVEEYREGGQNRYVHRLAGPARYPARLVLRRGLAERRTLWSWHYDATQGIIRRRNGSIVLLNSAGEESWRWNFIGAYPVRWVGPELRASTTATAVETIELVHQGIMLPR